jgi:hypothetical protein
VFPPSFGLPAVDERLAPPETRIEYLNGAEIFAAPAEEPHATTHSQIDRVVGSYVAEGYAPAVDMLTRTEEASDFAPDFSIFPTARDPGTKGRKLEEIAFEVTSEQSLSVPTTKARQLIQRGVRRVFCLLVKRRKVLEWSAEADGWSPIPEDGVIEDPCLVRPLSVTALLDASLADSAIAEALLVKRPAPIEKALRETHEDGRHEGRLVSAREAVLTILTERGLGVPEDVRSAIDRSTDLEQLGRFLRRAATAQSALDVVREG